MGRPFFQIVLLFLVLGVLSGCANVVPPSGGKADATAPKLLHIKPPDSLLNTRVSRIEMRFDEFVTVSDVAKELHISPALSQLPVMTVSGKTVVIKIPDSLIQENTTYSLNFGKAIRDLHESNPYTSKNFLFSTGSWFDSLTISGYIMDAASGKRDSSGTVKVLLYDAKLPFDIVLRQKPAYVTNAGTDGAFKLEGLPDRSFRIFALKETGDNLQFDDDNEYIGFADTSIHPSADTAPIVLTIFKEVPDTARVKAELPAGDGGMKGKKTAAVTASGQSPVLDARTLNYKVLVDTSNTEKRTQAITGPIEVYLSRKIHSLNVQRIFLSADSNNIETEQQIEVKIADTVGIKLTIDTRWQPNTLYTLRLLKGFIQDSSNADAMPSKYIFRTKSADDYGKMDINIPGRYTGSGYLLHVTRDDDSVYLKPISNTHVSLRLLSPGNYRIAIIEDKNKDGEWTTGDLKSRRHPEYVIPYPHAVMMKAGWEHIVDFEPKKK